MTTESTEKAEEDQTPWISLSRIPDPIITDQPDFLGRIQTNLGNQFTIAFNEETNELYALLPGKDHMQLLQYSFESDSWTEIKVTPPVGYKRDVHKDYRDASRSTAVLDCTQNMIFVWCPNYESNMALIYLSKDRNGETKGMSKVFGFGSFLSASTACGDAPKAVVIQNQIHLTGGNVQCAIDSNSNCIEFRKTNMFEEGLIGHGMVRTKNKMLTFGGGLCPRGTYDLRYTDAVYEYDIETNEWKMLPVKVEAFQGMGCTPILNGQYILVMGGEALCDGSAAERSDKIQIYFVRDQTISISRIRCPFAACHAVSVRDKGKDVLATNGYMRRQWKECGIADHLFPPEYILNLIAACYWIEYVHVLDGSHDFGQGEHYKIDVFDILASLSA